MSKQNNALPADMQTRLIEILNRRDTADIFTEIARGIDKWLWFVETSQQSGN